MARGWRGDKEGHRRAALKGWILRKGGEELKRRKVVYDSDYAREDIFLSDVARKAFALKKEQTGKELLRRRELDTKLFTRLEQLRKQKDSEKVRRAIASINKRLVKNGRY